MTEALELGLQALGNEILRLHDTGFLLPDEGAQLATYVKALCALSKEGRETLTAKQLATYGDGQLLALIAAECQRDPGFLAQLQAAVARAPAQPRAS